MSTSASPPPVTCETISSCAPRKAGWPKTDASSPSGVDFGTALMNGSFPRLVQNSQLRLDALSSERIPQRFGGHEIDGPALEEHRQFILQCGIVEQSRHAGRTELDHQIDVAVRPQFVSSCGPEQAELMDAVLAAQLGQPAARNVQLGARRRAKRLLEHAAQLGINRTGSVRLKLDLVPDAPARQQAGFTQLVQL